MKFSTLAAALLCLYVFPCGIHAGAGIKGLYVFGDNLSDTGNARLYADQAELFEGSEYPDFAEPYLEGRASNGPVWVETLASAYGFDLGPALAGGRNFAFAGAETGEGLSDQGTLNFHSQIRLFKAEKEQGHIKNIHPKDLFIVWFGINDLLRIRAEGRVITGEDIETSVGHIAEGILRLNEEGARMFLVPDMPAIYLTPDFQKLEEDERGLVKRWIHAFNTSLETTLARLEQDRKLTILRLSSYRIYVSVFDNPWMYGFENVLEAAIDTEPLDPDSPWAGFLFWDGFHLTSAGHAVLAQYAMNVVPIGSWWGHSVARGPDGTAILGMGWVDDHHWPWLYSYTYQNGEWLWAYEESGDLEGFLAYVPRGYKWIWINSLSGWYYDYETARWARFDTESQDG